MSDKTHSPSIEFMVILLLVLGVVGFALFYNTGEAIGGSQVDVAKTFAQQSIDTPLKAYRSDVGNFPNTTQGLQALITCPPGVTNWKGPYLATTVVPLDPWGSPYQYSFPGTHNGSTKYDSWSNGPDKKSGTSDDLGNW